MSRDLTRGDLAAFDLWEAALDLWPAGPGNTLAGAAPLFSGGLANRVRLSGEFEGVFKAASGEAWETHHHVNERHRIEVGRTWLVPKGGVDFVPGRNQPYILQLTWTAPGGAWYQRTYYGVRATGMELAAPGVLTLVRDLGFTAQYFTQAGGPGSPAVFSPAAPAGGATLQVPFFKENLMLPGDYFLGTYRWPAALTAVSAFARAAASQGQDTVLGLEVGGALTGLTLTLAQDAPNTDVTAGADLGNLTLPAGAAVRWLVVSGPGAVDAAWQAAVILTVKDPG